MLYFQKTQRIDRAVGTSWHFRSPRRFVGSFEADCPERVDDYPQSLTLSFLWI